MAANHTAKSTAARLDVLHEKAPNARRRAAGPQWVSHPCDACICSVMLTGNPQWPCPSLVCARHLFARNVKSHQRRFCAYHQQRIRDSSGKIDTGLFRSNVVDIENGKRANVLLARLRPLRGWPFPVFDIDYLRAKYARNLARRVMFLLVLQRRTYLCGAALPA